MSVQINMKDLIEAGVHYGHQSSRWNPKMKHYIYGERNGIHIIDLQKTVKLFQKACGFLEGASQGGHVLFVGTKRLARDLVKEHAERSGQYYINSRWLGGTLTNFNTMRQSIHRLKRLEKMAADGTYQKLPKKEVIGLEKERIKLDANLGGIKNMPGMPSAIFITDAHKETLALAEAKRLNIPVVAIADTNANPNDLDFPIPGNDDSLRSLELFIKKAADACVAGKSKKGSVEKKPQTAPVKSGKFTADTGNKVSVEKK